MARASHFPALYRYRADGAPRELVAPEEWRKLEGLTMRRVPEPPPADLLAPLLESAGDPREVEYGGSRRARQRRLEYSSPVPARFLPRDPPLGGEHLMRWRRTPGSDGGEWLLIEQLPKSWDASQIAFAYRAACHILRQIGLPPFAERTWCWRAAKDQWRALPDPARELRADDMDALRGAWFMDRDNRDSRRSEALSTLIEDFGGPGGPLDWAFSVLDAVEALRDLDVERRKVVRNYLLPLAKMPEWELLEAAVARSADAFLMPALAQLRRQMETGGADHLGRAFAQGFTLGQELGRYTVLDAVRAGEKSRFPGKPELRAALRKVATTWVEENGPLKPYVLAQKLIAETQRTGDARTELGRLLASLGLSGDSNRVGTMIREEAIAAGLTLAPARNRRR